MPRDGSGSWSAPSGQPVVNGTTISSTAHNALVTDIGVALTASIAKDGQTTAAADLPMGTYKHTGVGDSAARNQYGATGQIQDNDFNVLGSVSGTNTIVGSLTPAITGYSAGMHITLHPANTNSGAVTLAVNGLTALDVLKQDGNPLVAGDLVAGVPAFLILDSGADDWYLLNPADSGSESGSGTLTVDTGFSGTIPTVTYSYEIRRGIVTLTIDEYTGQITTTEIELSGLPAAIRPAADRWFSVVQQPQTAQAPRAQVIRTDGTMNYYGLNFTTQTYSSNGLGSPSSQQTFHSTVLIYAL